MSSVLITGSSKGLGKELALIFTENGYDIILHGRDPKDLNATKKEILGKGGICSVAKGDLRLDKTIRRLYETAKAKEVSILINNAAQPCPHLPLEEINDKQIEEIIITNLIAQIKLTKRLYSLFLKRGCGTIININSVSGLTSQKLRSIYCASKWGLRGFTDAFRLEAQGHKVRILDVYPSTIRTKPYFNYGMDPGEVAQKIYAAYKDISINLVKMENPKLEKDSFQ